jgi:hypothetical protein
MQISHAALISTLSFAPVMLYGQAKPAAPAGPSAPAQAKPVSTTAPAPPPATTLPATPSTLLQPALHDLEDTLGALKFDRWKKGSVRDEATSNANAILGDLKTKLPPLLTETDAANGSISQTVPLVKHLDALYDVLLRIEEASRVSGPGDQIDQLESTLRKFESARIALYDSMQQHAAGQEKQVADLQQTIKKQDQAVAAAEEKIKAAAATPPPCTPPKPAVKKKRPAPKPAAPANGQPAQNPPGQNPPAQAKPQQPAQTKPQP